MAVETIDLNDEELISVFDEAQQEVVDLMNTFVVAVILKLLLNYKVYNGIANVVLFGCRDSFARFRLSDNCSRTINESPPANDGIFFEGSVTILFLR